ncbi:MAG: hypothetical protein ACFFC7_21310 [Candidatus Hermodarchaeota archaeon]
MVALDLNIDPVSVKDKIISFIKKTTQERESSGVLVTFSGQNESFVVARLSIEALGMDCVKLAVIRDIPEDKRQEISSSAKKILDVPDDRIISFDIAKIARQFKFDLVRDELRSRRLEDALEASLVPRLYNLGRFLLQAHIAQNIVEEKTFSLVGEATSERGKFIHELIAHRKMRKRLKMVLALLIAETDNLILINETNKTQWFTGLFTTFGYGHVAEIMPLGDLYRTQVLQLGEYLDLPKEIRDLAYDDLMPGVKNSYRYFFELESDDLDRILVRLQANWSPTKISEELGIDLNLVERVNHFHQISKYQRGVPLIPKID